MHRILLYTLVVALLYLAWDARRGEVLAAGDSGLLIPSALLARAEPGVIDPRDVDTATSGELDPALQARLEARVQARPDVWEQFDLETPAGPPAEEVLAGAEAWMEQNFPEGGATAKTTDQPAPDKRRLGAAELADLAARAALEGEAKARTEGEQVGDEGAELEPIYVASLARIESLSGDLPAWCGLLDLALQPASRRSFLDSDGNMLASGDSAWISDDRGRLVARVEALDGLGFELDPSWPWIARQRRLFWTEGGIDGLPARQFRLVLEGNGFVPSWSGRLILIHSRPSGTTRR